MAGKDSFEEFLMRRNFYSLVLSFYWVLCIHVAHTLLCSFTDIGIIKLVVMN